MIWQIIIDFLKLLFDKQKTNKQTNKKQTNKQKTRITLWNRITYCLSL